MSVTISRPVYDEIRCHVADDPHRERCGLLLGSKNRITGMIAADNVHPDPVRYFELEPATLLAALRAEREGGKTVIGHYHSHPDGNVEPSREDAKMAAPDGRYWMILDASGRVALYHSVEAGALHGRFNQLMLDIVP